MQTRIIILEGPDNAGKTTLAQALTKSFQALTWRLTKSFGTMNTIHASGKSSFHSAMDVYHEEILNIVEMNGGTWILDRHWPSEVVYKKIFRPTSCPGYDHKIFMSRIKRHKHLYVICLTNNDLLEEEDGPQMVQKIKEGYLATLNLLSLAKEPYLVYDRAVWRPGDFAKIVMRAMA